MTERALHCYAEGRDHDWEAICLDLDIAVQGESFEDVFRSLGKAIALYLDSLKDLSEAERKRLLNRPAPMSVRLKFLRYVLGSLVNERTDRFRHQFTMPLAA